MLKVLKERNLIQPHKMHIPFQFSIRRKKRLLVLFASIGTVHSPSYHLKPKYSQATFCESGHKCVLANFEALKFEKSSYTSTFISDSATEKSSEIHAKAGIITIIIQSKYFSVSDWPRLNLHNQLIKTGRRFDIGTNDAKCVEYGQKKGRETETPESGSSAVLVEIKKMAQYFTRFAMKK